MGMSGQHWTAEEGQRGWRIRYDPTPGGRKNADGSTSYSLTFPVLELTEYVSEPERAATEIARELNTHAELLSALKGLIRFRNWELAEGGVTPADLVDVWKDAEAAIARATAHTGEG